MVAINNYDMVFKQFISRLPYPPNRFQVKILRSLMDGEGNIVVNALAGSGKTTLLVQSAQLLSALGVQPGKAMFLAFNVKIRDEMNKRLPTGFAAINSHRLGMMVLKKAQAATRVDFKKFWGISEELVADTEHVKYGKPSFVAKKMLENLCSKAMLSNLKLIDLTHEERLALPDKLRDIAEHFNLMGRDDNGVANASKVVVLDDMIKLVPKAMQKAHSIWQNTGTITFDEMIYWPVALNLPVDTFQYVFVDECQDLNILQQELAFRSCAKDGRMIFVGDKKQAIYGFTGADADGFDNIQQRTNAQVLPLNICYRCPTSHLDYARSIVPQVENADNAKEGTITYAATTDAHKTLTPGTLVMCRLTAPLVGMYFDLISNRVPSKMLGKDIAKMLEGILDKVAKMPGFTYGRCIEFLEEYEKRQTALLQQKEASENQVTQLQDSIECLTLCVQNFNECHTLQALRNELKKLFVEDDDKDYDASQIVVLCTVHRAKGLEAKRTAILKPDKMPLVWNGQQAWEFEQEMNILYVALTRSLDELIVFGLPTSLKVTATFDDSPRNTRRQTERPEEIEIEADVTDHLPDLQPIQVVETGITIVTNPTEIVTEEIPVADADKIISMADINALLTPDPDDDGILSHVAQNILLTPRDDDPDDLPVVDVVWLSYFVPRNCLETS